MADNSPKQVSGSVLRAFLESEQRWCIDVRRGDGSRSLQVDPLQARVLSRIFAGAFSGVVVRERLRYLTTTVPRGAMIRVLHMDPPRNGEISTNKPDDLHWAARPDRARGGIIGHFSHLQRNMYQRVMAPVPGMPGQFERRVVA